jgi:NitT/TauT family transport system substrate-binding protein
MKKIMLIGLAILLIAASFSGCIGNDDGRIDVVLSYQPSTHHMPFTAAKELGWWSYYLTQLDDVRSVSDRVFPSGPSQAVALATGAVHIAYIGAAPLIPSIAQGNDLRIIAAVQVNGSSLIVPVDSEYTDDPRYFEGKRIATFPPGSIQDTLLRQWLLSNDVDLSQVTFVGMGAGEAQTAFRAGAVDAVFLPHPAPSAMVRDGIGRVVMESGCMSQDHKCCVLAVSQSFIDAHPDIVAEILRIHIMATQFTNDNLERSAQYYANVTNTPQDIVLLSVNEWDGAWLVDPRVIEDHVIEYARVQYEQGLIPRPLTSDEIFDMSFFDAFMAQNG